MKKPDGGLAFPRLGFWEPVNCENKYGEKWSLSQQGMTLRDYFAAKAMQAIIISDETKEDALDPIKAATWAYEQADAMLAERDK